LGRHSFQDDGAHTNPTRDNILAAFQSLVAATASGDCAFVHYSGHGGRLADDGGDEDDGYDETLIPVDYQSAGQIRDDIIYADLVGRMPEGSVLTCLMDCCHSGTVLDLPYTFIADGKQQQMGENPKANLGKLQQMAVAFVIRKVFGTGTAAQIVTQLAKAAMSGNSSGGKGSGGCDGVGNVISMGVVQKLASMVCH